MKNKIKAFSLVEMLVALIIMSVVVAALTPVITRKLISQGVVVGSIGSGIASSGGSSNAGAGSGGDSSSDETNDSSLKTDCSSFGSGCLMCNDSQCLSCAVSCTKYEYIDPSNCTCKSCSDTYGLQCLKCNAKECTKETFCYGDDLLRIGNLCVTKKNPGDSTNIPLKTSNNSYDDSWGYIKLLNLGQTCGDWEPCCWKGTTSGSCDSANGSYSGCKRTVCNALAGYRACYWLGIEGRQWRVPFVHEMANWLKYSVGLGDDGLMLCDKSPMNGYVSSKCDERSNKCPTTSFDDAGCYPYTVMTYEDSVHWSSGVFYYLEYMDWYPAGNEDYRYSTSVRCVTEIE